MGLFIASTSLVLIIYDRRILSAVVKLDFYQEFKNAFINECLWLMRFQIKCPYTFKLVCNPENTLYI